ncbi:MAG: T9SS type A sorting domain-containing protein, partial [Bacteroidia bacterium]|nr:T9SS type A sorting domain-containing protein [Bacteroidia bacterium]
GALSVTVNGGTGPIDYYWSEGSTTTSITSLMAGIYEVSVVDAAGCIVTDWYYLDEPDTLKLYGWVWDVSCNNGTDGSIDVSVSGGTSNYIYAWSNGSTEQSLNGVGAGVYSITVMDANGCWETAWDTITEPSTPVSVIAVSMEVSCKDGSDGSASATAAGGTGGYTYEWNTAAQTQSIANLSAANYTVTATDANGCKAGVATAVGEPSTSVTVAVTADDASCNGADDGSISASGGGGTGTLSYAWSTGATGSSIGSLAPGNYGVTVMDDNSCSATGTAAISQPDSLILTMGKTDESDSTANDGTASADLTGGTKPYTYSWSNGATKDSLTGLDAGTYTVTAADANGCSKISSVTVDVFVGIFGNYPSAVFNVYPNPNNGKFFITMSQVVTGDASIEVYNILGEHMKSIKPTIGTKTFIDLGIVPEGTYLIRVITKTGSYTERVYITN